MNVASAPGAGIAAGTVEIIRFDAACRDHCRRDCSNGSQLYSVF
jgi:hypothetical protein